MDTEITEVQRFWNANPCQADLSQQEDRRQYFDEISRKRFDGREWHVPQVANFGGFRGQDLLEIGCGIATDGLEFAKRGARYVGVDLTPPDWQPSIRIVRCDANGLPTSVREVRRLALDVIKLFAQGKLGRCFKDGALECLDLYGMNFASEELSGISFRNCFLVEADFRGSQLAHASFAGAYLRNVNFAEADLSGADLTDADWFNALGLTESQLRLVQRDTLINCPPDLQAMHRFLKSRYGFPFESWSRQVQEQLQAAWNEHLRPGGLRHIVADWRRKSR